MTPTDALPPPRIERVRHELKRRSLTVETVERLGPTMLRVTLTGEDLADFTSLSPDDHCKITVVGADGPDERRDYTPRRFDRAARTLTLDFALHEAGPATRWALGARPGDSLVVGGPRGSAVIQGDVRHWLLVGDETALPAIGRRIEEAPPGTRLTAVMAVPEAADEQAFRTAGVLDTRWVHRPAARAADSAPLVQACEAVDLPPGTFVWIAAEATVARALRALFTARGVEAGWIKAAGYWAQGRADAHEVLDG